MKKAFTMIELIFVIVILGILAAVAIPKLAATRSDAEVSKIAHNVMVGAAEIASYAVSNAKTEDDLKIMSNGMSSLESSGNAVLSTKKAVISIGSVSDCLTLEIFTSGTDDNLTISLGSAGGDNKCLALQSAVDAAKYPMKLRGQSVTY
ncbi:MAG: type II secretion system protein [Sulfurimonas sp.]|nr:type II secretion system protein [Sulfurimonas sp.]